MQGFSHRPPAARRRSAVAGSAPSSRSASTSQLLVLEMVRAYVDQAELLGCARVLTDERLRPAVGSARRPREGSGTRIEPGPRRVPCRTSFAERFREPWRASRR
ncbi:hypothetical protein [Streptomyces sp. KL116D]|uniref:hypothetical protein n=1 Tax=Streptomyces sp. KL116D TaxID=3045152 RepID=UPI003557735D